VKKVKNKKRKTVKKVKNKKKGLKINDAGDKEI